MNQLFHIFALSLANANRVQMTAYPMPFEKCETVKSKLTNHKGRVIVILPFKLEK